jgi:hypothetical protein
MAVTIVQRPDMIAPAGINKELIFIENGPYVNVGKPNIYSVNMEELSAVPGNSWEFTWGAKSFTLDFVSTASEVVEEFTISAFGINNYLVAEKIKGHLSASKLGEDYDIEVIEVVLGATTYYSYIFTQKVANASVSLGMVVTPTGGSGIHAGFSTAAVDFEVKKELKINVVLQIKEQGNWVTAHTLSSYFLTNETTKTATAVISDVIPMLRKYVNISFPYQAYKPVSINSLVKEFRVIYYTTYIDGTGALQQGNIHFMDDVFTPSFVYMAGTTFYNQKVLKDYGAAELHSARLLTNNAELTRIVHKDMPQWVAVYKTGDFTVTCTYFNEAGAINPIPDLIHSVTETAGFMNNSVVFIPIHPKINTTGYSDVSSMVWNIGPHYINLLLDKRHYRKNRFFLYQNSLGGLDTFWCKGIGDDTIELTAINSDTAIDTDDIATDETIVKNRNQRGKISTGWIRRSDLTTLEELVSSKNVWKWNEFPDPVTQPFLRLTPTPIEITNNKITTVKDDNKLISVSIEYRERFTEEFYSPIQATFLYNNEGFKLFIKAGGVLRLLMVGENFVIKINGIVVDQLAGVGTYDVNYNLSTGNIIEAQFLNCSSVIIDQVSSCTANIQYWYTPLASEIRINTDYTEIGTMFDNMEQYRNKLEDLKIYNLSEFDDAFKIASKIAVLISLKDNAVGIAIPLNLLIIHGTYNPFATEAVADEIKTYLISKIASVTIN